jgi:hypothetical protein
VIKDLAGQELKVGDMVVSAITGRDPFIAFYKITSLDGMIEGTLSCERHGVPANRKKTNTRAYDQVLKIDPKIITFMELQK